MKINHETLMDEKEFGDNTFRNQTPLKNNDEKPKIEKEKIRLPKRQLESPSEIIFYILHALTIMIGFISGAVLSHPSLFIFAIPYAIVLFLAYRLGGTMKAKGLNHVIWNLSVFVSTYTNANMKALRQRYKTIGTLSIVFMTLGGIMSGLLLATGLVVFLLYMALAFAEMETEEMSKIAKIASIALLVSGTIALFVNPGIAHGTLVISLLGNWMYEKWNDYEFIRD